MGAVCAPSYACLHLGWWEREDVYTHPSFDQRVILFVQYIDNVLLVWRGPSKLLEKCFLDLNKNNRNIFLTSKIDLHQIEFLDLKIIKDGTF